MNKTDELIHELNTLPPVEVLRIAERCKDILVAMSVVEYSKRTGVPERTVYDRMKKRKIKTFCGFPCLNLK